MCEFCIVYQVGQRVSESDQHPSNRIFLAVDAVHMHSPIVELGMNTSMKNGQLGMGGCDGGCGRCKRSLLPSDAVLPSLREARRSVMTYSEGIRDYVV